MNPDNNILRYREILRDHLPILSTRFNVRSLGLFGSFLHDRQDAGSDLDVLVEFDKAPGLIGYIELEYYLSELLGVRVDLVMKRALRRRIGERILQDVMSV
jgi:uncharacterized protein